MILVIRTCAYQGVRTVRFSEKFDVLCFFLNIRFQIRPFLPYYRRITQNACVSKNIIRS